jgi:hypothetical protein
MPLLVKLENKRIWDKPSWLPAGEVPAQAVQDFRLEDNELSVWYVEANRSNIDRIVTALAANRDFADKIDYAVFDEASVGECGITLRKTTGKLPDEYANQEWHRDLVELSGRKLVCLAELIATGTPDRKTPAAVKELLATAAKEGHIKRELMKAALAAKLEWPE